MTSPARQHINGDGQSLKLLVLSDLHLEAHDYTPSQHGYDLVVLAGDIHTRERGVGWAIQQFSCPVIYVPGNHEGYGTHWQNNLIKMKQAALGSGVTVLNNDSCQIRGIRFLGATGWCDFKAWPEPGEAMRIAGSGRDYYNSGGMQDYRLIRTAGYRRIRPADTGAWAVASRQWLQQRLAEPFDGPTVVVTHHAPSARSLPHGQVRKPIDAAYVNAWDDLVASSGADLWCHGHTHHPVDYQIGRTQVVSNPRGYPGEALGHRTDGVWTVPTHRNTMNKHEL